MIYIETTQVENIPDLHIIHYNSRYWFQTKKPVPNSDSQTYYVKYTNVHRK